MRPDSATAPQPPLDMSPQGLMTALIGRGVTVEVCAILTLPGLGGGNASVLIDGGRRGAAAGDGGPPCLGDGTTVWYRSEPAAMNTGGPRPCGRGALPPEAPMGIPGPMARQLPLYHDGGDLPPGFRADEPEPKGELRSM